MANVYFRRVVPSFSVLFAARVVKEYVVDHHFLWWVPLMIATWLLQWWPMLVLLEQLSDARTHSAGRLTA